MKDAILNFAKQFEFNPVIVNPDNFKPAKKFIVCGMGGSSQAADIIKAVWPDMDILIRKDYGLPPLPEKQLQGSLMIASSYSGNTEEPIEFFVQAKKLNLNLIAISIGAKLLELAKKFAVPYIQIPDTKIQPRSALGFSIRAMLKAMGQEDRLAEVGQLAKTLKPRDYEAGGQDLAKKTKGFVPIIYASSQNFPVAYVWKIKLNETGKIPAFYNVIPELNHNEMNGFSAKGGPAAGGNVSEEINQLSEKFYFIILKDPEDNPKIIRRMEVIQKLYKDRGLPVETIDLTGENKLARIFSSLLVADWFALHTAEQYGLESEQVPMVEEFKKLIE